MTNPSPALLSLVQLAEKAPPPPWDVKIIWRTLMAGYSKAFQDGDMPGPAFAHLRDGVAVHQAEFICAARAAIPALAVLVEQLKAAEEVVDATLQHPAYGPGKAREYRQRFPRAALDTKARGDNTVAEGYVMVPKKLTAAMRDAGYMAAVSAGQMRESTIDYIWERMLSSLIKAVGEKP